MMRRRLFIPVIEGDGISSPNIPDVFELNADTISGSDGDAVSAWADGAISFDSTLTKRPLLKKGANGINGHNVVRFDGSNDILVCASSLSTATSGVVIAVVRLNLLKDFGTLLASADEASALYYWHVRPFEQNTTTPRMSCTQKSNDTTDQVKGSTLPVIDTPYIMVWQSTGTAYRLRINGDEETEAVVSGANNGDWLGDTANRDNFTIGSYKINSEGGPLQADVAYIRLFDGALTDGQIIQVENYLSSFYGVALGNP